MNLNQAVLFLCVWLATILAGRAKTSLFTPSLRRGVNRQTDRRNLKTFLPGFRIQSEILTDFRILQLKRIADSSIFWARILDFACNLNILTRISDSGQKWKGGFG